MSKPYKTITVITVLMTLLAINHLTLARERLFEQTLSAQEANEQLATLADILVTTKLWQDKKALILIADVEVVEIGIGGNFGRGILIARSNDQNWGNPIFIRVASKKIETPDSNEPTAVLMAFKDQQNLTTIIKNGAIDAEAAQVYAYDGQSFTQVSLTGLINVEINRTSNTKFYGQQGDATKIISGEISTDSMALKRLLTILNP